jgi:hypothetical protein
MWYAASDTKTANTFRVRRAELKLSGKVSSKVAWAIMIDPSKSLSLTNATSTVSGSKVVTDASVNQSSRLMQDAFLTVDFSPVLHLDAGQFRLPIGNVGSTSSGVLETVERPMFQSDKARGGTFGDVRDVGFVVRGAAKKIADYWVGAYNGSGDLQNNVDANNQKSVVGRVSFYTPVTGLRVGASGLSSGFKAGSPTRRDRYGAEAVYTHDVYLLRAEVQKGFDGTVERGGGFFLVGIRPSKGVQVVSRVDVWDPDMKKSVDAATARTTDVMGGATWFLAGDNAKLQVNVSHRWFAYNVSPAVNQILVNLQTSW